MCSFALRLSYSLVCFLQNILFRIRNVCVTFGKLRMEDECWMDRFKRGLVVGIVCVGISFCYWLRLNATRPTKFRFSHACCRHFFFVRRLHILQVFWCVSTRLTIFHSHRCVHTIFESKKMSKCYKMKRKECTSGIRQGIVLRNFGNPRPGRPCRQPFPAENCMKAKMWAKEVEKIVPLAFLIKKNKPSRQSYYFFFFHYKENDQRREGENVVMREQP